MPTSPRRRVTGPTFRWFAFASFLSMIAHRPHRRRRAPDRLGAGLSRLAHLLQGPSHRLRGASTRFIEYGNRMVTIALVIVVGATLLAAIFREPRRRDLDRALGSARPRASSPTRYSAPSSSTPSSTRTSLSLHLVLSARDGRHRRAALPPLEVRLRTRRARRRARPAFPSSLARWLWFPFVVLVLTGTATTGSGPHAGAVQGQLVARRLPFAFSSAAWVHSLAAVFFIGLVVGLLLAIWHSRRAERAATRRAAPGLLALVQAAIGVTQYLTHVPPGLVELHVLGAVVAHHRRDAVQRAPDGARSRAGHQAIRGADVRVRAQLGPASPGPNG